MGKKGMGAANYGPGSRARKVTSSCRGMPQPEWTKILHCRRDSPKWLLGSQELLALAWEEKHQAMTYLKATVPPKPGLGTLRQFLLCPDSPTKPSFLWSSSFLLAFRSPKHKPVSNA